MLLLLYHFIWTIILVLVIPPVYFTRNKRYSQRVGLNLPEIHPKPGCFWIHALSVGEVISAIPLIKILRLKYPDKDIVFSTTTSKGMVVARKELKGMVHHLMTMPLDAWWPVHRVVHRINPDIFILVETDIWPGLLHTLRKKGIRSFLVNGRISPRTFRAYNMFSFLIRRVFQPFEACLMQSELDRERLIRVGMDSPEKVITTGNIKFDREWAVMGSEELESWRHRLGVGPETLVWVSGSTHPGEEGILLRVQKKLLLSFPSLLLVLAPRKIERSYELLRQAEITGLKAVLRTELTRHSASYDVLILDTIGELARLYGIGQFSFVGGSLIPFGGHNLLEPASFGCPVLFGPHMHNFAAMADMILEAGGGMRIGDEQELYDAAKSLLDERQMRQKMGQAAERFVRQNQGALERVISHIMQKET